jgi:CHAD domain-containing protein
VQSHLEIERKYDAASSWDLPDLSTIEGVGSVQEASSVDLHAIYFDTGDLLLLDHRITLRRRTGGGDEGWHLKLPGGEGGHTTRLELQSPLTSPSADKATEIPAPLMAAIQVHVRDRALIPVAEIRTRRSAHWLRATDGTVLAEVADDQVTGTALNRFADDEERTHTWHEIEVELVDGETAILDAAESALLAAGATPAAAASKLARTLGVDTSRRAPAITVSSQSDAGTAVGAYLTRYVRRLMEFDPDVRQNDPNSEEEADEAVHQMRVCTRRLRSVLATYRVLYDRETTDPVRDELAWIGGLLGALRDVQVIRAEVLAAVAELPADEVVGPVRRRLDTMFTARATTAHDRLLVALDSARYFRLLDALEAFVDKPTRSDRAALPAQSELPGRVRGEWKRVASRHKEMVRAQDSSERDVARHALRRAAKRARYAAEVAEPVCGADATRFITSMSAIQTSLGTFQDTVIVRATLTEATHIAATHIEDGFTYGLLIGRQQLRADTALREFDGVWDAAVRRRILRWLG